MVSSIEVPIGDEEVDHDAHVPSEQEQVVQDVGIASLLVID